jgi:hypothetical protein
VYGVGCSVRASKGKGVCQMRVKTLLLAALSILCMAGMAQAYDPVPEIDPGVATGALTLLAGGVLILAAKFRGR